MGRHPCAASAMACRACASPVSAVSAHGLSAALLAAPSELPILLRLPSATPLPCWLSLCPFAAWLSAVPGETRAV